jgi:16S rRNA (adenine1518-N6/adenine1519-N6)-dimethyltransferase
MSLKADIVAALSAAQLAPLHRFGQNFMIDQHAVDALINALGADSSHHVVEIGPGTGVLTKRLLASGAMVTAVEIDRGLYTYVSAQFHDQRAQFIHGDCLATKNKLHPAIEHVATQGPWRLGANLPYDVALPVLLNAAALPRPPEVVVVTVQYEAAERLCARPSSPAWGASAATFQAAGVPQLIRKLSPSCFYPQPRVDSAILRWQPTLALDAGFGRWCRNLFTVRRKVLSRALRDLNIEREQAQAAINQCGFAADRRVEMLDAPELVALFRALNPYLPEEIEHVGE